MTVWTRVWHGLVVSGGCFLSFQQEPGGPNPHTKALIEHACAPLHLTMERKTGLPKKKVPPRWLSGFSGAVCMDGRVPLATQLVNSWGGGGGLRRFSAATSEWERHAAWYCQGFLGGAEARSRPCVAASSLLVSLVSRLVFVRNKYDHLY